MTIPTSTQQHQILLLECVLIWYAPRYVLLLVWLERTGWLRAAAWEWVIWSWRGKKKKVSDSFKKGRERERWRGKEMEMEMMLTYSSG